MPGQEPAELRPAMPHDRKDLAAFLNRARRKILGSHSGLIISRYREDILLMLYKRSCLKPDESNYYVSATELLFCDSREQTPPAELAAWYLIYNGRILNDAEPLQELSVKMRAQMVHKIESFLVAAVTQNDDPDMFRGPETYEAGDWTYLCTQHGDFAQFKGEETVFHQDRAVFRGSYMGQTRT